MKTALDNLKTTFEQVTEIEKLLASNDLYVSDFYVDEHSITHVIPVMASESASPLSAVWQGYEDERGSDLEVKLTGACIVGLKSGHEYVIGHEAYEIEEFIEQRKKERSKGLSDDFAMMREKLENQESLALGDLAEVLLHRRYVSGAMINLQLIGIAGPKNG